MYLHWDIIYIVLYSTVYSSTEIHSVVYGMFN